MYWESWQCEVLSANMIILILPWQRDTKWLARGPRAADLQWRSGPWLPTGCLGVWHLPV